MSKSKAWHEAYYNKLMSESKLELESFIINGDLKELGWAVQHAIQAQTHREEFLKKVDE